MIGGIKTPFRVPCVGSSPGFTGAVIKQTGAAIGTGVDAYGNTTKMTDHCGNIVAAKERLTQLDVCGNTICTTDCNDCPGGFDLLTNTPEPPAISANTWLKMGKVSLDAIPKGGKWIQAFKAWHGRYGFNYDSATGLDCATGLVKSNSKFRTVTMTSSYFGHDGVTYTITKVITVSKNSGETLMTTCATTASEEGGDGPPDFSVDLSSNPQCSGDTSGFASWLSGCDEDSITTGPGGSHGTITQTSGGVEEVTLEVTSTRTNTSYSFVIDSYSHGITPPTIHWTGSITLSDEYTMDDVLADAVSMAAQWLFSDDKKNPFRQDKYTTIAPMIIRKELAAVAPVSVFPPCTLDDYSNPIDDGSGNHPFASGWFPTWAQMAWVDMNAYVWQFPAGQDQTTAAGTLVLFYDGSLIGAPLDAGYGWTAGTPPTHDGVFNKDHNNWQRAFCPPPTDAWENAVTSRGAYTPVYLPANAPNWTDDLQASSLFPAAFINADEGGIYLQKWAEVPIARPSINFARPFGPDKFAIDETDGSVFFVSDFTAGVVTLKNNTDFSTPTSLPFTTADIVGSAAVGGFFAVTFVGTNTVTLGAKVYDVPGGWDTPSKDGSACFGRLRNPTAPGMDFTDESAEVGGRVAITVANESPVKLATATVQKYLSITTPENIDIYDAAMTLLAGGVAATRSDDNHFTVPTAYATLTTAKWIVPSGGKYKFADTRSKGDYVYRTWTLKVEDNSVLSATQIGSCLPNSPCGVSEVFITPNGETANGNRHDFPTSINNGERWIARAQFSMVAPFWQSPHKPVAVPAELGTFNPDTDLITWSMDDGTCQANFTSDGDGGGTIFHLFYPLHPFVEARCTIPVISGETPPAPPVDITAVADHPAQATLENAEGPLVNAIGVPDAPWIIYQKQKACVDAAGVFAPDYHADGI